MTTPVTPDPSSLATSQRALDKAVVGGLAWTAGVKWVSQLLTWAITLVVARLLTPADFGLVGMATIFLGLITLLNEFGLGTAVVTFQGLTDKELSQLHTICALFGLLSFLVSCAFAVPLGIFFRAPKLPMVIVVTATGFLVVAYRTVPYAVLQKEMRFKLLAILEGIQVVAQSISTLIFAVLGFGYWALVIGGLVGKVASSAMPFVYKPLWFARPRWESIERELRFSWHVIVGRLYYYAYDNADLLVIGRVLGEVPLGAYSLAYNLAHLPADKFATLIVRVAPSLFAAVQNDLAALRRYLRNLTQGIALVIFPAGIGTALVAPEAVHLILGKKWLAAIAPLQLLALYACFRAIRTLLSPLLNALAEPQIVRRNHFLVLAVLPLSFYIASRWGTAAVAACWVFVFPLLSLPLFFAAFRKLEMSKREYLMALWPALSSSIPMVLAVALLKWFLPISLPLYVRLSSEVLAGAAAYSVTLLVFHRQRVMAFYQLRKLLSKAN